MNKERWYRADFVAEIDGEEYYPDSEYYVATDDNDAIEYGKKLAEQGWEYVDVGHHVEGELICVTLLDGENDFAEIKVVY